MSVGKRKVVDYNDLDDSPNNKRLRYEDDPDESLVNGSSAVEEVEADVEDDLSVERLDDEPESLSFNQDAHQRPRAKKNKSKWKQKSSGPNTDTVTGQRAFVPGIDDEEDEEEDEDTIGALAYLRSVRSEASLIPSLLTAPKADTNEEEDSSIYGDSRGYYSDGAYVSAPALGPSFPPSSSHTATVEPQEAFYQHLQNLFLQTRYQLHSTPTKEAVSELPTSHPITFPSVPLAAQRWAGILRTQDPHPVQLACMDTETVLRLLRMCGLHMKRRRNIEQRLSAWLWSLLARLPDVGTMGSEEVSVVRELGKRVVWMHVGWQMGEVADATEGFGGEDDGDRDGEQMVHDDEADKSHDVGQDSNRDEAGHELGAADNEEDAAEDPAALDAARSSLLQRLAPKPTKVEPDANTTATLDMVLTIAGEIYGQRDLLEFRHQWTTASDGA